MRYLTVILMGALFALAGCGGDTSDGQTQAPATTQGAGSEETSADEAAPEISTDEAASDKPQWAVLEQNVIHHDE